jgi:hypothetical protein
MHFGGVRTDGSLCPGTCDDIPLGLTLKSDDAGCPYWYAPEDAPKTCSVFPDTGAAIDTSTPD